MLPIPHPRPSAPPAPLPTAIAMTDHRTPTTPTPADVALRDHFAGQAFAALLIAPKQPGVARMDTDAMAKSAYDYADALIRARGT